MIQAIKKEVQKVIVGHEELIDSMLIALLSEGHILLEGVPGIAKTTAVNALAKTMGFAFKRIQFTPDLLPSDITGNEILDMKKNDFTIKHGPIFTNLLLADEINRAGAKVQSALLEAMAEKQVTIGEETLKLNRPFMVFATSNPIDQEGTYELPEASLDRFMLKVKVGYNSFAEEKEIVQRVAKNGFETIEQVVDMERFCELVQSVKDVHVEDAILEYMLKIIFATREPKEYGLDEIADFIEFGASPRGSIDLYKATKARAYINQKDFVTPLDVVQTIYPVLRHRIILNYKATSKGITTDEILDRAIKAIKAP